VSLTSPLMGIVAATRLREGGEISIVSSRFAFRALSPISPEGVCERSLRAVMRSVLSAIGVQFIAARACGRLLPLVIFASTRTSDGT
jgi:hypothetical protein